MMEVLVGAFILAALCELLGINDVQCVEKPTVTVGEVTEEVGEPAVGVTVRSDIDQRCR